MRHLINLVLHWDGPITVAVYAPGTDYYNALEEISYLRHCLQDDKNTSLKVRDFMSFSIIFPDGQHMPEKIYTTSEVLMVAGEQANCSKDLLETDMPPVPKFCKQKKISTTLIE